MRADVATRAKLYATGAMRRLVRRLEVFRDAVRSADASGIPGHEKSMVISERTVEFAKHVEDEIASGFVIGHGAGLEDREERPRWKR